MFKFIKSIKRAIFVLKRDARIRKRKKAAYEKNKNAILTAKRDRDMISKKDFYKKKYEKSKEAQKRYIKAHRKETNAYARKYYKKNRETILANVRRRSSLKAAVKTKT